METTIDTWTRASFREVADCRVFKVREDTSIRVGDGTISTFFVVESPDWVNILALTKEHMVVLIEQFRHGTQSLIAEIPGGMIDSGEAPVIAAGRELLEETGFTAGRLIPVGKSFPNPAIQNNTIHHFLALECEKTHSASFDDHESIGTRLAPFQELEALVHNGDINHSLAVTALYFANRYLRDENIIT